MTFREEYVAQDGRLERSVTFGNRTTKTTMEDRSGLPESDPAWSRWWRSYLRGAKVIAPAPQKTLNVVDLFGGCGGLSTGVREAARAAGLEATVVAAVDLDDEGLQVYARNLAPRNVLHADVSKLVTYQVNGSGREAAFSYPPELLDERLKALVGQVDLLVGGPPCEGHSNLNNHTRRDDPRNLLYVDAVAIAVALKPKAIIIENVPDVVNDHKGVVQTGIGLLQKAGYTLDGDVLSAHSFGLPQTRKRFFLVGMKEHAPVLGEVEAAIGGRDSTDLAWAIKDLADSAKNDPLTVEIDTSAETKRRIDWLFDNKKYELADHMRPDSHKDGHTYGSVYGRLRWDAPSGTITTGFLTMGRGRFVHPSRRRTLTPREAARIQGFPDSFDFRFPGDVVPSKKAITKWIGDAVPPILGYAAAMAILPVFLEQPNGHVAEGTSARMRAVKPSNTTPEAAMRKLLRDAGIPFDTNKRGLPGTPDVVFHDQKVAVFVHGCYWHRHEGCDLATMPKTNVDFWSKKFETNVTRDKRTIQALRREGWHPIVVWECELRDNPKEELRILQAVLDQRTEAATKPARQVRKARSSR